MIKLLIVLGIVVWLAMRFRVFLSKVWIAFVEPALDRVGDKASEVISKESKGPSSTQEDLSKNQAEELRR